MASQLIEAMSGPWRPADFRDTYTDRVNELIEAKKNKKELQTAAEAPAGTNVTDLMRALRASLDAASNSPAKKAARGRPATGRKPGPAGPANGRSAKTRASKGAA
jgi:DNA end-binding protein Ku